MLKCYMGPESRTHLKSRPWPRMEVRRKWAASHFDSFIPQQRVILHRTEKGARQATQPVRF